MILLTGNSGFLGKVIYNELIKTVAIDTISRSKASLQFDLSKGIPILNNPYSIVIHSAGKAHCLPKTESEKKEFFDINVNGTLNLLKGLEKSYCPVSFVFISSVAVYGQANGVLINEDTPLAASDTYGVSKIAAEKIVQNWCKENGVICTVLRLPLLVGDNPPGNLGAMIRGIKRGYYFNIDGGNARKSMVLAKDVAKVILPAAKKGGVYNLTDGHHPSFIELSQLIAKQLGVSNPYNLPLIIARLLAGIGDFIGEKAPINTRKLNKVTNDLTFDDSKARQILNWRPNEVLSHFKII